VEVVEGGLNDLPGGTARMVEELFARDGTRDVFFLDSATPERTRFSYMGGMGGPLWRRVSYTLNEGEDDDDDDPGGTLTVEDRRGSTSVVGCPSIFDWITGQASLFSGFDDRLALLPFEFWGGPIGYLGYELKCQTGGQRAHRSGNCDACFFVVDRFICADHHTGDLYAVAVYDTGVGGHGGEAAAWVASVAAACRRLRVAPRAAGAGPDAVDAGVSVASVASVSPTANPGLPNRETSPSSSARRPRLPPLSSFTERHPQAAYMEMVERCQASLHSGDSYELCLTNMLRAPRTAGDADPWSVYMQLRRRNPAPYAAFLDFSAVPRQGRRASRVGPVLCCSSPERFLRGTRDGALEAKPIKGTARRHPDDPKRDREAARRLLESEKDRAENLMIVDLLRNDLGRVAETGSVRVPGLMRLESFATVHQMVSTIVAQKRGRVGTGEVIRAAFPGGSMTGAPKVRSMAILDALEGGPRGVYSGSLGYISWSGAFDLNIVIRTAIFSDGEILVGAGGAIVVQSDPRGEYDEMRLKFETLRVA
jgi:para-aminobenzoate synthetase